MGIKNSVRITAEILSTKASRLAASAAMQQAERLLQDEPRPVTVKVKRGKQSLRGRTRVERVRPAREVEVEESFSWGYVQPDGTVTAHCDSFTIGVVVDSGAEVECPDLPRYYFRYVEGGRNYRVIRK